MEVGAGGLMYGAAQDLHTGCFELLKINSHYIHIFDRPKGMLKLPSENKSFDFIDNEPFSYSYF